MLSDLRYRLRAIFKSRAMERELDTELQQHYEDTLANPYIAADRGYVDGVIPPSHTRGHVGRALRALATKREAVPPRKHGNIPL